MVEFKKWEKMTRENPFSVTITEKIDGTNACIVIQDGCIVGVQSRNKFITPEADNYGFAKWVWENEEELLGLGEGHHFGEWAGLGIQNNPLQLSKKEFFLFNVSRWNENHRPPECTQVVPVLFQGLMDADTIPDLLNYLKGEDTKREGVCVFYHALRKYTKHTIESPNGKWCK